MRGIANFWASPARSHPNPQLLSSAAFGNCFSMCRLCELGKSFPWQEKHLFFTGLIFCCFLGVISSLRSGEAGRQCWGPGSVSPSAPSLSHLPCHQGLTDSRPTKPFEGLAFPPAEDALMFCKVVLGQGEMLHPLSWTCCRNLGKG